MSPLVPDLLHFLKSAVGIDVAEIDSNRALSTSLALD